MPSATFHFPTGFLWGTSTSAYQVEGCNTNTNWSEWEKIPGKIYENQMCGNACDWWSGRWKEDLNRMKSTNQNAHRLSIEWSRVQPAPDRWDENALDYYRKILMGFRERNITPFITLHHFTEPIWISEIGSWENNQVIGFFNQYVEKVIEALKEYCNYWIPINEPNVLVHQAYLEGNFPPGKSSIQSAFSAMSNLIKAHSLTYATIKRIQPLSRVGTAINYRAFWPKSNSNPLDAWITKYIHNQYNESFMKAITKGSLNFAFKKERFLNSVNSFDFVGINYYSGDEIKFSLTKYKDFFHERSYPQLSEISENGFISNVPNGFETAIKWVEKFNKPIVITENGVEDSKDQLRPQYLIEHIQKLWRAVNLSVPVRGYFHWTLVDNFEWERGWSQRFGLWRLNLQDQSRIKTKSAELYAQICKSNSISSEMVQQFAPHIYSRIFPG